MLSQSHKLPVSGISGQGDSRYSRVPIETPDKKKTKQSDNNRKLAAKVLNDGGRLQYEQIDEEKITQDLRAAIIKHHKIRVVRQNSLLTGSGISGKIFTAETNDKKYLIILRTNRNDANSYLVSIDKNNNEILDNDDYPEESYYAVKDFIEAIIQGKLPQLAQNNTLSSVRPSLRNLFAKVKLIGPRKVLKAINNQEGGIKLKRALEVAKDKLLEHFRGDISLLSQNEDGISPELWANEDQLKALWAYQQTNKFTEADLEEMLQLLDAKSN